MVIIAVFAVAVFHPSFYFPDKAGRTKDKLASSERSTDRDNARLAHQGASSSNR